MHIRVFVWLCFSLCDERKKKRTLVGEMRLITHTHLITGLKEEGRGRVVVYVACFLRSNDAYVNRECAVSLMFLN